MLARYARYIGSVVARGSGVTAVVTSALLATIDGLDPSASGTGGTALTASEALPRALGLAAVAVVVAVALAPAVARSVLSRGGAARALRAAGADGARVLAGPVLALALLAAPLAGGLAALGAHEAALHPGARPQPLDVVPWAAARSGHWALAGERAVFTARRATGTRTAGDAMPWLLALAALGAAPMALGAAGGASRQRVGATWAGAGVALLVLVAGVVGAAHAETVLHAGWRAGVVGVGGGALAGAALGRVAARLARGPRR